jgi:hypothetical protein
LKVHGRLKSSNCVLDGRWVVKVTDWGLDELREHNYDDDNQKYQGTSYMPLSIGTMSCGPSSVSLVAEIVQNICRPRKGYIVCALIVQYPHFDHIY